MRMSKGTNPLFGDDVGAIIAYVRPIVQHLNHEKDVRRGGLYHTLPGSMSARLKPLALSNMPVTILFMQEIGLLRRRGAQAVTIWQVADASFFDEFVSKEWIVQAKHNLDKHLERTERAYRARQADGDKPPDEPAPAANLEHMAEMVATVERMAAELVTKDEYIAALQAQLAERPKDDPQAVAAALVERFRKVVPPEKHPRKE